MLFSKRFFISLISAFSKKINGKSNFYKLTLYGKLIYLLCDYRFPGKYLTDPGEEGILLKTGAVPAAVNPVKVLVYPATVTLKVKWEGSQNRMSQKTCL